MNNSKKQTANYFSILSSSIIGQLREILPKKKDQKKFETVLVIHCDALHFSSLFLYSFLYCDLHTFLTSCHNLSATRFSCLHAAHTWGIICQQETFWWSPTMSAFPLNTGITTTHNNIKKSEEAWETYFREKNIKPKHAGLYDVSMWRRAGANDYFLLSTNLSFFLD